MSETDVGSNGSADLAEVHGLERQYKALETSILLARAAFMRQAGITFNGARDEYEIFGYDRVITNRQYRDEYARGGIAGRVVDVMPDACWRGDPPFELIEDEDPAINTPFEQAWQDLDTKHKICSKFLRVDKLSRLSTFATLLIGAPGNFEEELPRANARGLLYLMPFSGGGGPNSGSDYRNTLAYDFGDCSIHEYETDVTNERFGLPKSYQLKRTDISSPTFARPVHWSRIVHVAEGLLDDEVYGQPALERVWNLFADLRKVTGGGAEAFWLRANQGLHLDIDKDMSLPDAKDTVEKLKEQAEAYKHQLTRWLRTRGVSVETLGSDVANFANPADAIITQIAGSKAIPKRILTGSEMGELASSQDRENFKDQVNGRQMQHCAPNIVRQLADRLITYGYLPTPTKGPLVYDVLWSHMQVLTEQEKAEGASKWMGANQAAKNAGLQPVFTEAETRDKWYGMAPMSDEQKAEIEQAKRDAMELAQEMAPPAPPQAGAFPRAAEAGDEEIVRVLAAAIEAGNAEVVHRIIGLEFNQDQPRDEQGQWTSSGLEKIALKAGQKLYGPRGETGKLVFEGVKTVKKTKLSQISVDEAIDDFEYVFKPSSGKGVDAAGKGIHEHAKTLKDKDNRIYTYDATNARVRIIEIDTKPLAFKESKDEWRKHGFSSEKSYNEYFGITPKGKKRSAAFNPDQERMIIGLQDGPHDYGTTQVQLPADIAERLFAIPIADGDIYSPEGGRETDAHITVCYGLIGEVAEDKMRAVLSRQGWTYGSVALGKTQVFSHPDYDVVYVAAKSQDLANLHLAVTSGVEVKPSDHADYLPHATVAYVKAGTGEKYVGLTDLEGATFRFDSVVMVSKSGERTTVRLA